jgi:hypothetical protein
LKLALSRPVRQFVPIGSIGIVSPDHDAQDVCALGVQANAPRRQLPNTPAV